MMCVPFEKLIIRANTYASKKNKGSNNSTVNDADITMVINPANGLPMVGAFDIDGNAYGSISVNPANGLPMVGGVDVCGNTYGTDSS